MSGRSKKYQDEKIEEPEIADNCTDTEECEVKEEDITAGNSTEINALNEKVSSLEKEIFEYRDKLVRKVAEFDNYRKRTSEEFLRLVNTAGEDLIIRLLPVIDDIERFQKNYTEKTNAADLKKGVDLIFEKLNTVLKNAGLSEIEAVNTPFDPEIHDALLMVEKEGAESNTVVDQHEKGYRLNDKVIRHSKVIVAK